MKKTTKKLTKEQKETIWNLYKQGKQMKEIILLVGCSEGQFRQVVYIDNDGGRPIKLLNRAEIQVVQTFHNMGMDRDEIAGYFGVSKYNLSKSLRNFGVRLKYRKPIRKYKEGQQIELFA